MKFNTYFWILLSLNKNKNKNLINNTKINLLLYYMTRFINFGCWNKYGCAEASGFQKVSSEAAKIADIDFLIVNGDNYYKDKLNGIKSVNNSDLLRGLHCLNQITDNEIYLLLGNHDLEVTDGHCETLVLEKAFSLGVNSQAKRDKFQLPNNLVMFKEIGDTFIIMIDSNIYADENPTCYKVLEPNTSLSIQELKQQQYNTIREKLQDKHYKNIIVCAHHPLIGFKNQVIKNEENNGKMQTKVKGGLDVYNVDYYTLYLNLLRLHADHFFHLCSDIHNYQQGSVTINGADSPMIVQQYIVGTGGTDLDDDYNEKYTPEYGVDSVITSSNSVLTANIVVKDEISLDYNLEKHNSEYGFIVVTVDHNSTIQIESIQVDKERNQGLLSGTKGGKKSKKRFKLCKRKTNKKPSKQ
jgi:hypothetical protein